MRCKSVLFVLMLFVVCAANQAAAQEFVTDGLVSFWSFDSDTVSGDTAHDVWGNNDGTIVDGTVVAGKINEGLEFTGSSTVVDITPDASLDITDAMSIEAWIKMSVWQEDPNRNVIMSRYNAGEGKRYVQFSLNPGSGMAIYIGIDGGSAYVQTQKGTKDVDWVDNWVHLAFTWDMSDGGLFKFYVNGTEVESYLDQVPLEAPLVPVDMPWSIGGMAHRGRYFAGVMDEVRIYEKRLSDAEIMTNFNAQSNAVAAVQPANKLAATWGKIKL